MSTTRALLPAGRRIAVFPPSSRRALSTTRTLLAKEKKSPPPPRPPILEKPAKFNPPSHGSRLPRGGARPVHPMPQHYGGELPKEEIAAQRKRSYPTLMAPEGTWAHWFWTSRLIHAVITTGTLLVLGAVTYFLNMKYTSPFKDLIPPTSDALYHPIEFVSAWSAVIGLHSQERRRLATESRSRKADDAIKRQAFQRAHNMDRGPIEKMLGGRDPPEETKPAEAPVVEEVKAEPKP